MRSYKLVEHQQHRRHRSYCVCQWRKRKNIERNTRWCCRSASVVLIPRLISHDYSPQLTLMTQLLNKPSYIAMDTCGLRRIVTRASLNRTFTVSLQTRKLCYRKDDRAVRPVWAPWKFSGFPDYAHGYFSQFFFKGFCSDWGHESAYKI